MVNSTPYFNKTLKMKRTLVSLVCSYLLVIGGYAEDFVLQA